MRLEIRKKIKKKYFITSLLDKQEFTNGYDERSAFV